MAHFENKEQIINEKLEMQGEYFNSYVCRDVYKRQADQCGYIESGLVPKFAGCVDGANWFKSNGKWQNRTYEPKAGDIIFFDWEGDGTTDHVGICLLYTSRCV